MKKFLIMSTFLVLALSFFGVQKFNNLEIAQRGCCSHHSGVCGCRGGVVRCCDGTPSPTCRCRADEGKELACAKL